MSENKNARVALPPTSVSASDKSRVDTLVPKLRWSITSFSELDGESWYEILKLRSAVFVVEQNCVYQDIDDLDRDAQHVVAWREDNGSDIEGAASEHRIGCCYQRAVACARLVVPGVKYVEPSIGRVVSDPSFRGLGLGKALLNKMVELSDQLYPNLANRISAQLYLEKFYRLFGFATVSESYLEDGLPHIEMLRPPASATTQPQKPPSY